MTAGGRRHDMIIVRFEDFLETHPDQPLYLTEICAAIGVAERTLRVACEEHLGMAPNSFSFFAEDASCPPRASTGGSLDDNRHPDCHRSRASGSWDASRSPTELFLASRHLNRCAGRQRTGLYV